ncbi:hypothetical protein vseg_011339 [Gypsophila vaccaria]
MGESKRLMLIFLLISIIVVFNGVISVDGLKRVDGKKRNFTRVPLGPNQRGPEALAFDCKGQGPYVGISDGRILKWQGQKSGWTEYAVTAVNRSSTCNGVYDNPQEKQCGRPLGLKFDPKTCDLYIADSSVGLLQVGPKGGVASPLAISVNDTAFTFLNALDVDFDKKVVYFTESSTEYHRWDAGKAMEQGYKPTGRLLKYDMKTKNVTVLLKRLSFANGIALSKNKDFVLVASTITSEIRKYWIAGPKEGLSEVILLLRGRPDNIHSDINGDFWIAILDGLSSIKVNEYGEILDSLEGLEDINPTDVQVFGKSIWVGYVDKPFVCYTSI